MNICEHGCPAYLPVGAEFYILQQQGASHDDARNEKRLQHYSSALALNLLGAGRHLQVYYRYLHVLLAAHFV